MHPLDETPFFDVNKGRHNACHDEIFIENLDIDFLQPTDAGMGFVHHLRDPDRSLVFWMR